MDVCKITEQAMLQAMRLDPKTAKRKYAVLSALDTPLAKTYCKVYKGAQQCPEVQPVENKPLSEDHYRKLLRCM